MTTITRSGGTGLMANGVFPAIVGGGYQGCTAELDAVVTEAAQRLNAAYKQDIEIRFNSDRESGGAFLVTSDGQNCRIGVSASLVTASKRECWEQHAVKDEAMARTGICPWGGDATEDQRRGAAENAQYWRGLLADCPDGQLTVYAHIMRQAALPHLHDDLAALPGWNDMGSLPQQAYHHGEASSVAAAVARCLRFAPRTGQVA